MKVGHQIRDTGAQPVTIVSKMTRDQAMQLMQQQGRVFLLASVAWEADREEATIRLDPGNGVEWQYILAPVEE